MFGVTKWPSSRILIERLQGNGGRLKLCGIGDQPPNETILDFCEVHNDDVTGEGEVRVLEIVIVLHSADSRYRDECGRHFMASCSIRARAPLMEIDQGFENVTDEI